MKKYLIGIGAAAIIALAAACGASDDAGTNHSQTESTGEHNEQDIAFAQMMIPHHQQAVDMAKMAVEKATDPKVLDLASRIEGAQDPEIRQMTTMLEQWDAPTGSTVESMPGMDHGEGMMTDEEMTQLEQSTGADFDRLWLRMMIRHHEGAVTMAKTELDRGGDSEAKDLAKRIVDAQEAEIAEMRAMLT